MRSPLVRRSSSDIFFFNCTQRTTTVTHATTRRPVRRGLSLSAHPLLVTPGRTSPTTASVSMCSPQTWTSSRHPLSPTPQLPHCPAPLWPRRTRGSSRVPPITRQITIRSHIQVRGTSQRPFGFVSSLYASMRSVLGQWVDFIPYCHSLVRQDPRLHWRRCHPESLHREECVAVDATPTRSARLTAGVLVCSTRASVLHRIIALRVPSSIEFVIPRATCAAHRQEMSTLG